MTDAAYLNQLGARGPLIGPDWVSQTSAGLQDHISPTTGAVQASYWMSGAKEIDAAVAAAREALPVWKRVRPDRRRDLMNKLAALILENADQLADISAMEGGIPVRVGRTFGQKSFDYLSYYAGWADKIEGRVVPLWPGGGLDYVKMVPYGVVAVITPWNGYSGIARKIGPAIAAGNTVVYKPPELTPFAALRWAELALEAGLPPGVVNIVPGDGAAGAALVGHPGVDKITFTGGGATARQVLAACAVNITPAVLELGGKSANIIFPDADLDAAAGLAATGCMNLTGQGCINPTRLLIHRDVYDAVIERVIGLTQRLRLGDPLLPTTTTGPLISRSSVERVLGVIEQAVSEGAGKLVLGGERAGGALAAGNFVQPAVFTDVDNASALAQEEIFGPVLAITPFADEAEAIELANGTRYGLAGYVHTRDLARAHRVADSLEAGYLSINGMATVQASAPFAGAKDSGYGVEGGEGGLLEFVRPQNVFVSGLGLSSDER